MTSLSSADEQPTTRKLVYLLWGDGLHDELRGEALRGRLAEAGAVSLQVNVSDEAVAGAMRIPTFERPVTAVVSVWTSAPADAVTAALTELVSAAGGDVAGWRVDERRPLEPPAQPDGVRGDTLANVAVLRQPAELDRDEWLHRWLVDHTPVAIETQATFGYVQNVVAEPVTPDAPRVDAIVEELFPPEAATDMHAFYGSGGDQAELDSRLGRMMASIARFGADRDLDLVPTSRYTWRLG